MEKPISSLEETERKNADATQFTLCCIGMFWADRIKTSLNGLKQPFQSTLMIIREERTLTIVDIHKTKENGKTILKTKASCGKMSLV
ncbi:MAG: hypothetical protein IJI13_04730 [Oscillospiraceae bacterium]|nr:hypothetical protein [Oscillospiraceae bacterium]